MVVLVASLLIGCCNMVELEKEEKKTAYALYKKGNYYKDLLPKNKIFPSTIDFL